LNSSPASPVVFNSAVWLMLPALAVSLMSEAVIDADVEVAS
jgi:hypothetical protein